MKQCIENPNDVDWASFWAERLTGKVNKNWDEAAPGFYKRTRKEDYNSALFDKLILDENDTVLDVGCGEGSVTVPLAKRVKKVIGIDSSPKMLEYLEKRAIENNIDNIETILKPIEEITYEEIGEANKCHDELTAQRAEMQSQMESVETKNKLLKFVSCFSLSI